MRSHRERRSQRGGVTERERGVTESERVGVTEREGGHRDGGGGGGVKKTTFITSTEIRRRPSAPVLK